MRAYAIAATSLLTLFASATGCGGEVDSGDATPAGSAHEPNPVERARSMASRDAWLGTAFREARTLVRSRDGFRSATTKRGDTAAASFARASSGPFSLRAGQRNAPLAELRISGLADAELAPDGNLLTAEVAPGVVTMFGLAGEALEQFVYSKAGSPLSFDWHLTLTPPVTSARPDARGNLAFADASGRELLRIPRPYAVDEAGNRLDVAMTWATHRDGQRLAADVHFVTPEGHGPLLVDPALEVVFWQEYPGDKPPSRNSAPVVYHPDLGAIVMYGGDSFGAVNDTWAFDGEWRQLEPMTGAPARYGHAMAYIKGSSSLVVFGGRDENGTLSGATLRWNGSTWSDAGITGPSSRDDMAMAYAPVLGSAQNVAFLFGGSPRGGALGDSWAFNGTKWTAVTAPAGPDERYGHSMFYDDARKSVVVSGGARGNLFLDDIYGYDGSAWSTFTPVPTARTDAAMAFDSKRKTGVVFGGLREVDTYAKGTWEWHSEDGTWAERVTSVVPAFRADAGMAYDPKRERAVMYGGYAGPDALDTWETWEYGVLGGSCTKDVDCDQYTCVDGACCEATSCGPCSRCSVATGACEPVVNDDDADSCTGDSTCDEHGECKKKVTEKCTKASDCLTGFCADGFCCNERCDGACEACDTDDSPGKCTLVKGDPRHGQCDGDGPCGSSCTGGSATCQFVSEGVSCGTTCKNAKFAEQSCDGKGTCVSTPADACANDLTCADGAVCRTSCAGDDDCTPGHVCRDGACATPAVFCKDGSLHLLDGTVESCGAYACVSGACLETCNDATQCAEGLACNSNHECVKPPNESNSGGGSDDSGCGCSVPGREGRPGSAALAAFALALAGLRAGRSRRAAARRRRTACP